MEFVIPRSFLYLLLIFVSAAEQLAFKRNAFMRTGARADLPLRAVEKSFGSGVLRRLEFA
jgi:hypothetical protein